MTSTVEMQLASLRPKRRSGSWPTRWPSDRGDDKGCSESPTCSSPRSAATTKLHALIPAVGRASIHTPMPIRTAPPTARLKDA